MSTGSQTLRACHGFDKPEEGDAVRMLKFSDDMEASEIERDENTEFLRISGDCRELVREFLEVSETSDPKADNLPTDTWVILARGTDDRVLFKGLAVLLPVGENIDADFAAEIPEGKPVVHVHWVFVHPEERGKGMGRKMWETVLAQTKGSALTGAIRDPSGKMERMVRETGGRDIGDNNRWLLMND